MRDLSPFERAFERGELRVPAYLTLLHLASPDVATTLDRIEQALEHPEHAAGLRRMLADSNWRPHLVAATALLAVDQPGPFIGDLWTAVRRGSWVTPQLLVVASLLDPEFETTARARLSERCPVEAPSGTVGPSAKEANALVELLDLDRASLDPALEALVVDDLDDGARLAAGWRIGIKELFAARGRALELH